jgi:threonine/homoserine/homoserine lactone efflux protein
MPPFVNGLFFGLLFIFSIGPAFFALVQTSIQKGFKPAIFLAVGISLSDVFYVSLVLLGISSLLENPDIRFWMGVIGTILLIGYGIYSFTKPVRIYASKHYKDGDIGLLKFTLQGLLLNGFNPFIVLFWVAMLSIVSARYDYDLTEKAFFFAGVLSTILCTDTIKAFIAHRLKNLITPKIIKTINRVVGVILMLFGMRIVYFLINNYWL